MAPMATTTMAKNNAAWQAEVGSKRRFYATEEPEQPPAASQATTDAAADPPPPGTVTVIRSVTRYVVRVCRVDCDPIDFPINHREGRGITFTDPRDRGTGIAGVTGIWGTRPAPPVHKPRPLSPTAFRLELARLIGTEPAAELVQAVLAPGFFPVGFKRRTGPL